MADQASAQPGADGSRWLAISNSAAPIRRSMNHQDSFSG
jgi:hypothetical protein